MAAKLRTIGVLVFTLMLFVACASEPPESATPTPLPPTATSPPRPTDTPPPGAIASKVEDVVGVWKSRFLGTVAYMHFKPDATFRLDETVEETNPYVTGKFWFEGTVFHVDDDGCHDPGTYEVRVLKEGDKRIQLTFTKIKDPCRERANDWRKPMLWVEP